MNKNLFISAVDDIKASEDFKKRASKSMMEKSTSRVERKNTFKKYILIGASFLLIVSLLGIWGKFSIFSTDKDSCGGTGNVSSINEMFLSNGNLYYTKSGRTLYQYNNSTGKSKIASIINKTSGSTVFENKGYIYYSNGKIIYQKSLYNGKTKKIAKGKNIGVTMVCNDKLFYSIAYKDSDGKGYSQFEYHIYDLDTGKDNVLFKRCKEMWYPLATDGINLIADGYLENDSGIFVIDLSSKTRKKLSDMRADPVKGCIINDTFYFSSKGLWSVKLNGDKLEKIPLPEIDDKTFMITGISGFGSTLYVAASYGTSPYDEKNSITAFDLQTGKTNILVNAPKRIYNLCTDGKNLYFYCASLYGDKEGYIKTIPLH